MADTKISAMIAATAATASTVPVVQGGVNKKVAMTGAGAAMIEAATTAAQLALLFSANGAASAPAASLIGTWFTGGSATTTKPQLLIEPTGTTSTGWSTSGTGLGVNAVSGFAGNLLDLQVAGVSKFAINSAGNIQPGSDKLISVFTQNGSRMVDFGTNGDQQVNVIQLTINNGRGYFNNSGLSVAVGRYIGFGSIEQGTAIDVFLYRKAAATLQIGPDAAGVTNQMFTAASRITSDGVGANLTIAAGNGRGGAGGSLLLSYYTTAAAATIGTLTTMVTITTAGVFDFTGLTTSAEVNASTKVVTISVGGTPCKFLLA